MCVLSEGRGNSRAFLVKVQALGGISEGMGEQDGTTSEATDKAAFDREAAHTSALRIHQSHSETTADIWEVARIEIQRGEVYH